MIDFRKLWPWFRALWAVVLTAHAVGQTTITGTEVPLPPARKAPTEIFRELLAASPSERERLLAKRAPEARAFIEKKLGEFEVLPPDQRELRLRVAELQFFLSPLLQAPSSARTDLLNQSPEELRPLLVDRLRAWDSLSAEQQQDLVESQRSLSWFVRSQVTDPRALTNILSQVPAPQRSEAEAQLARWRALSPEERSRKTADFQRFFDLSEREQAKVLNVISPAERNQMEASLARFAELPPDQRERAVSGFRRFLALTAPDRAQFLQNIAHWQAMTPAERAAWRQIVARVTMPAPIPPESRSQRLQLVTTNSLPR